MLSLLLAIAAAQSTAVPPSTCTSELVPPELAGWNDRVPLKAGVSAALAGSMPIGKAMAVVLPPTATVSFALPPDRVARPDTFAGLATMTVTQPGRYRIALGAPAWIDLVHQGAAVRSVSFGHGPACSTVRKMVDFDLTAGSYTLQWSNSTTPTLAAMIVRLP